MVRGHKGKMGASFFNGKKSVIMKTPINSFKKFKTTTSYSSNLYKNNRNKFQKDEKKPAELYRADLISAMKVPDSEYFTREDYILFSDPWRGEWDKGVQVPVLYLDDLNFPLINLTSIENILLSKSNISPKFLRNNLLNISVNDKTNINLSNLFSAFYQPADMRKFNNCHSFINTYQQYNSDLMDILWLQIINDIFMHSRFAESSLDVSKILKNRKSIPLLTLKLFEGIIFELEKSCYTNFKNAYLKDKENYLEFDENVICDVCRSPDSEEDNEMVFCDICNICVHQACYGILKVPKGSWMCNPCKTQINQDTLYDCDSLSPQLEYKCCLCPNLGGALKPTPSGTKWCHVSCALWIPEIGIGDPDKMEPILGISRIPAERWNFICAICKGKRNGACIQCAVKSCRVAFHVTCGFRGGLDMKADWHHEDFMHHHGNNRMISHNNTHQPKVKLRAFCPKHSRKRPNATPGSVSPIKSSSDTSVFINSATHTTKTTSNLEESRFQRLKQLEYNFSDFVDPAQEVNKILLPLPSLPFHDKTCFYPSNNNTWQSESSPLKNTSYNNPTNTQVKNKTCTKGNQNSSTANTAFNLPQPHPLWIKKAFNFTFNYWKLKRRQRFNAPLVPSLVPLSNVNSRSTTSGLTQLLNQIPNRSPITFKPHAPQRSSSPSLLLNAIPFDVDNCYSSSSIANSLFAEDCFNPINFSSLTQQQLESNLYHRLKMCVQLRQDLERVRNLSYMLIRREKMGGIYVRSRNKVWNKQQELVNKYGAQAYREIEPSLRNEDDSFYQKIIESKLPRPNFDFVSDENNLEVLITEPLSSPFTNKLSQVRQPSPSSNNVKKKLKYNNDTATTYTLSQQSVPADLLIKRKYNNLDRLRSRQKLRTDKTSYSLQQQQLEPLELNASPREYTPTIPYQNMPLSPPFTSKTQFKYLSPVFNNYPPKKTVGINSKDRINYNFPPRKINNFNVINYPTNKISLKNGYT